MATINKEMKTLIVPKGGDTYQYEIVDAHGREETAILREDVREDTDHLDAKKADRNELASSLVDIGTDLIEICDRITIKADTNEVAGAIVETERQANEARIIEEDDVLRIKEELGTLYTITDRAENSMSEFSVQTRKQADINDIASVAADLEVTKSKQTKINEAKANVNDVAAVARAVDNLESAQDKQSLDIGTIQSSIGDLFAELSHKVSYPEQSGEIGQVLAKDTDDTTKWIDPAAPSDEQIEHAVTDWLDDHPEATTTVQDGSITMEKLSADVVESIGNSVEARDALELAGAVATIPDTRPIPDQEISSLIEYRHIWDKRLDDVAGYTTGGDALLFLWFTDPHTLKSTAGSSETNPYYMINQFKDIRRIYESTSAKFVLCGGDWLNEMDTKQHAMKIEALIPNLMRREICEQSYTLIGNHDINLHGAPGDANRITEQELSRVWYDRDVGYFTFEGRNWKCILFDSGNMSDSMTSYRWEQIAWFAAQLLANNKLHLFGSIHIHHNTNEVPVTEFYDNITKVADAYNRRGSITLNGHTYNFSGITSGTFHFIMYGHQHSDQSRTNNNIPGFCTRASYVALALDACYVDWTNAVIHMVRFGPGSSRNFNFIPTGGYQTAT